MHEQPQPKAPPTVEQLNYELSAIKKFCLEVYRDFGNIMTGSQQTKYTALLRAMGMPPQSPGRVRP